MIDDFGKTQKDDVTESYKSAMKAATEQGYKVDAWTLCIPRTLDGPETTWWTNWKRRRAKDGPVLELMDEGEIRRRLMVPGAAHVRDYYFSPVVVVPTGTASTSGHAEVRALQELADNSRFDNALFVHQMEVANLPDTRAAREAFFNAEILTQEIEDKAVSTELANLSNWRVRVDSTWSNAFNSACQTAGGDALPGLFQNVMDAIEQRHHDEAAALRASVVHGIGIMHQRVENERAGWVRNWQELAESHSETLRAPEPALGPQFDDHAEGADDEPGTDLVPATIPPVEEPTTATEVAGDPDA